MHSLEVSITVGAGFGPSKATLLLLKLFAVSSINYH